VIVQGRLSHAPARRTAQQPLQLPRRRASYRQRALRAAERAFLRHDQRLDLRRGDRRGTGHAEQLLHAPAHPIHPPRQASPELSRPLIAERDRQIDLGDERAQLAQVRLMAAQIRLPRRRRLVARIQHRRGLLDVALGRVGPAHPPEREVRLDREREPREPSQPLTLVGHREKRIRHGVHPVQAGPCLPATHEDVLMDVAQRKRGHGRTSST
jgi:hypothetical protein